MPLRLNAAVGKKPGTANNAVDVRAVQQTLIERATGEIGVTVNGQLDAPTIAAIMAYQKHVLKLPFPDGTIAVGGATHNLLNDPNKKFPGLPVRQGVTTLERPAMPAPGAGTPAKLTETGFWEAWAREQLSAGDRDQIGEAYRRDIEPIAKGIPGFFGRIEDGRRLGKFAIFLWRHKLLKEAPTILKEVGRLPTARFDSFIDAFGVTGKAGKVMGALSAGAEKVGLITLFIDIVIHGTNGNWGAAAGEVYKTVMNKAVPWAGMIEGLQSLMDAIPMDQAKKTLFFKVLRFCDPVGLGGSAFDSLYSLPRFILTKDPVEGTRILNEAVARLEAGPTGVLKAPAEAVADWVYEKIHGPVYKGG